jgi:Rrf2 family protein
MLVSTKGRYALRMMIDLARFAPTGEWIPLKDISTRQDISIKYLEQIVQRLCNAGMLRSLRGPLGGYRLANPASQYTAGQILRCIEGSLAPVGCLETQPNACERYPVCPSVHFWEGLYQVINQYVDGVTLEALAEQDQGPEALNYNI